MCFVVEHVTFISHYSRSHSWTSDLVRAMICQPLAFLPLDDILGVEVGQLLVFHKIT